MDHANKLVSPCNERSCLCQRCSRQFSENIEKVTDTKKSKRDMNKISVGASGGDGGDSPDTSSSDGDEDKDASNDPKTSKRNMNKKSLGADGGDDGDHPSDDDKDDDVDKDESNEKYKDYRKRLPRKVKRDLRTTKPNQRKPFNIDSKVWKECIGHKKFENRAKVLLLEGTLPDKDTLNRICTRFHRKSQIVQLICKEICTHLQQQSDRIVSVWAAYRYSKENNCAYGTEIIFVILTKEIENIHIECDFELFIRGLHEICVQSSHENTFIHEHEIGESLTDDETFKLKKCIVRNSKLLMNKHSNITRVTLSWFKLGSSRSQHNGRRIPCVALYVHIKGIIPINEDPITEAIDLFPVDIREGVFRLHGKPTDYHKNLKMGCVFDTGYGTYSGTVGPFIKLGEDSSYYCLTSSHVVLSDSHFQRLKDKCFIHYGGIGLDDYQPPESKTKHEEGTRYPFGRIEAAVYKKGNHIEAGMEIALLKVNDDRRPIDFTFPDIQQNISIPEGVRNLNLDMSYETIIEVSNLSGVSEVYKYGGETRLTKGKIRFDGTSVGTRTFNYSNSTNLTLHGQIEVIADGDSKFGKVGDSGSLVLVKINDRLVPFGIFEGVFEDHCYVVTPLANILKTISETMSRYHTSTADQEVMEIEGDASVPPAIRIQLKHGGQERNRNRETEAGLSAEFKENIMFHTEHKINVMKTELTEEMKKEIRVQTTNINTIINQQNTKHEHMLQQQTTNMNTIINDQNTKHENMLQQILKKFSPNLYDQNGQN